MSVVPKHNLPGPAKETAQKKKAKAAAFTSRIVSERSLFFCRDRSGACRRSSLQLGRTGGGTASLSTSECGPEGIPRPSESDPRAFCIRTADGAKQASKKATFCRVVSGRVAAKLLLLSLLLSSPALHSTLNPIQQATYGIQGEEKSECIGREIRNVAAASRAIACLRGIIQASLASIICICSNVEK